MNVKKLVVFISFSALMLSAQAPKNHASISWQGEPTSYLFAPGVHMSERQIARYLGDEYVASTGQRVVLNRPETMPFEVIQKPYTAVNFPEVNVNGSEHATFSKKMLKKPENLVAHLYHKIITARNQFHDKQAAIDIEEAINAGIDINAPFIKREVVNFGQIDDILTLSAAYDQHVDRHFSFPVVLYGVSRGAATTVNFLATKYPTKEIQNVRAVVLEGCFDDIKTIIKGINQKVGGFKRFKKWIKKAFSLVYPGYDPDGHAPHRSAADVPMHLPILLITSKKDLLVPAKSTEKLYRELKKTGHDVYLLILDHSGHPRYMLDHQEDTATYQAVVHAFYQRYGLAHVPHLAALGMPILDRCRP